MFKGVNIYEELVKEKIPSDESLLREASMILQKGKIIDEEIANRLSASASLHKKEYPISGNEQTIFAVEQIKSVCLKYRLRFLDSKFFKGAIPYEAILKIKEIERRHGSKFNEFKILAPARLFKLEDRNKDPLLFANLGNGKYLLIHKWGTDMSRMRKLLAFPLRTIRTFIFTLLSLSLLIAAAIPAGYAVRMFIFLFSNLFFLSLFAHVGYLRLNQNFSEFEWDSKFVS